MPATRTPSTNRRKLKTKPRNVYTGAPLRQEAQIELDHAAAMTPERIAAVKAALIPELRELLNAKVK